jgi:hypothetical protein
MRQIYKCPPKATTTVATPTAMPYTEQGVLENIILPAGFRGSGNALHSFSSISSNMDFSGSESINGNMKSTNGPLYDAISKYFAFTRGFYNRRIDWKWFQGVRKFSDPPTPGLCV